jgi:hypothetical protein
VTYPPKNSAAREALEHLADLTSLLGIASPHSGRVAVQLHLSPDEAHRLSAVLLSGLLTREFALTPDAPVWCARHDGVGAIVRIVRHEVTLRALDSGERWDVHLSDIRPATVAEIRAADMPPARRVTA